ncbi:MAG: cysteine hydrolase [Lachnospiraceae bacterium]|nr:cysteine hydrolase [Lachnospiraceae bacterium]
MRDVLVIIDVQNDYFPGGTNELYNPLKAEKKIKQLIDESRKIGRKIVYIQHINPPDDYFFLEGTFGAQISERIKPEDEDKVIIKHYPNSFLETELDEYLKSIGAEELIVCGMMTHMCVDTTVRAAMDYGYRVKLVADACATMDLTINGEIVPADMVQKAFIASLDGVFAEIV